MCGGGGYDFQFCFRGMSVSYVDVLVQISMTVLGSFCECDVCSGFILGL